MIRTKLCCIAILGLLLNSLVFIPLCESKNISELKEGDLHVFRDWIKWQDNRPTLRHYLNIRTWKLLDARKHEIEKLSNRRDWLKRISRAKARYQDVLRPMPQRTPLNAKITGQSETDFCRIERILFESRPEMYVTACLFIPKDLIEPRPAVLYVCGHTSQGYRSATYQNVILNLTKKGFVVLALDPVGQGERLMYFDPDKNQSLVGGPTSEHSYAGKQCFVTGDIIASYFLWDMVRAIDYLETRPEVDATRIAVHGRSGGGTQSSLIMAYDDRVAAAAPENYITSLRRLMQSVGPQDAEQILYRGISLGLNHADFIEMRAPKPTLIIATTNDYFNITGVHETVDEAKKCYEALGKINNLQLAQDEGPHGSTEKNRGSLYKFLREVFDFSGNTEDEMFDPLPDERLNVTETGQVISALGGKTVFDYNRDYAEKQCAGLVEKREYAGNFLKSVQLKSKILSGYREPCPLSESPVMTHRYIMDGYRLETWSIPGEYSSATPILLAVPDNGFPLRRKTEQNSIIGTVGSKRPDCARR